jgi:hypothetical protein
MMIVDVEDVAVKNKVMKKRQYRSRQGRSDRQYEDSVKVISIAALIGVGMVLAYYLAAFISGIANV